MTKRPNHFRDLDRNEEDGHPVDLLVAKRLSRKRAAYTRCNISLAEKITKALGPKGKLFAEYDTVCCDWTAAREETFFNVGYEQGLLAGKIQALNTIRSEGGKQQELTVAIREQVLGADMLMTDDAEQRLGLPDGWLRIQALAGNLPHLRADDQVWVHLPTIKRILAAVAWALLNRAEKT